MEKSATRVDIVIIEKIEIRNYNIKSVEGGK